MEDCIFCKIIKNEIPCDHIYDDENFLAFLDIRPVNKGHVLIVPREHHTNLLDMPPELLEKYLPVIQKIAKATVKAVKADGCNVSINNGAASGQVIFHTHFHIIPRFENDGLKVWPRNEETFNFKEVGESIKKLL
ncbi:HIT family protein [Candidatus Woesearchaeota archaeon]|nr:HIT family protein [Candidatus Woesearchaeota archaeon]